jgi:hypothetical protein
VSAALVVTELLPEDITLSGQRSYEPVSVNDRQAIDLVAERIVKEVDAVLGIEGGIASPAEEEEHEAECSCSRALPSGTITIEGHEIKIAGLPLIFEREANGGLKPDDTCGARLREVTGVYHAIPVGQESPYELALAEAYRRHLQVSR